MIETAGFDVVGEIHLETIVDLVNMQTFRNPLDGIAGPNFEDVSAVAQRLLRRRDCAPWPMSTMTAYGGSKPPRCMSATGRLPVLPVPIALLETCRS